MLCTFCPDAIRAQISKLEHSDSTAGNFFGVSVSIDGDRVVIGASGENACGENSGAAYIYDWDRASDTWKESARLVARDCEPGRYFGRTVSISENRVLIGSSNEYFSTWASSAAYLFEQDSTTGAWEQIARFTADPDLEDGTFATSVALDGDRALITTSGDPSGRQYGGAAYVFERNPRSGFWERTARLTGSGGPRHGIFGGAGDLDGDRIAVASSSYADGEPGSVYIFERNAASGVWEEVERIDGVQDFFISIDMQGDRLMVGEGRYGRDDAGAASVFRRAPSGSWHHEQTIRPSAPYDHGGFGTIISLYGDRALIASYDEQLGFNFNIDRVVYAYEYDASHGKWAQRRVFDVGEIFFGSSIDHNDRWAVIGQVSESEPGAAYIVRLIPYTYETAGPASDE